MTRLQDHDLDDFLDDIDALSIDVAVSNLNRIRKKKVPHDKAPNDSSGFSKWVDTRKGAKHRTRAFNHG